MRMGQNLSKSMRSSYEIAMNTIVGVVILMWFLDAGFLDPSPVVSPEKDRRNLGILCGPQISGKSFAAEMISNPYFNWATWEVLQVHVSG